MKKHIMIYWLCGIIIVLMMIVISTSSQPQRILQIGIFAGSNWNVPTGSSYERIENAIALFNEKYPDVKVEFQSGIRTDTYEEWLSREIIKDQLPDVFFLPSQMFSTLANNKTLENLTSYSKTDSSFSLDQYYENSLKEGMLENELYALPYESVPTLMFVNKSLLNKEGIEIPKNTWTWDDFYSICQKVSKDTDGDGIQDQFCYYDYTWEDALYSTGTTFYDEINNRADLSSSEVVETVAFMRKLNALNSEKVTSVMFDKGQVAFQPMNYSDYRTYMPYPWRVKKYSNFEWDCITMPASATGGNISQIDTLMLGLSSRSDNKAMAWEFMKLLSSDDTIQGELAKNSQAVSVIKSVMTSQTVIDALKEDNPGSSGFEMTILNEVMEHGIAIRRTEQYNQIVQIADAGMNELMNNDADIENGLASIQRQIDTYLRK